MTARSKPLALVIGSGSVKCAAAIGLLNVPQREKIELGMVVGCSGGSMYATLIALGFDSKTIAEMTRNLWTREVTSKRNLRDFLSILMPRVFGFSEQFGLTSDGLVMKRLGVALGNKSFADAKIPLYISATDFSNGEQAVLSQGRLVDAIRASIAVPYIFKPHRVDGRWLVDGYLSDPLPVGVAIREGAGEIIAMGFDAPHQNLINSLMRFSFQISSIRSNNLYKANFAFHNFTHHSEIIPIIPNLTERIGLFDTDKIPYITEEGERAATQQLPYIKKFLESRVTA